MSRKNWIIVSGGLWFAIGLLLLYRGLGLLALSQSPWKVPFLVGALLIGYLKSRFVLSKAAHKLSTRILTLPLPLHISHIYPPVYLFLLLGMMGFSGALRFLPLPFEIQGFIKAAVGAALLNGSFHFAKIIYGKASQAGL